MAPLHGVVIGGPGSPVLIYVIHSKKKQKQKQKQKKERKNLKHFILFILLPVLHKNKQG